MLSGVRIDLQGDQLAGDRHRPRAHDRTSRSRWRATATASPCCRRASRPTSCARSVAGAVTIDGRSGRRAHHRRPLAVRGPAAVGRRLPAASRTSPPTPSPSGRARSARRCARSRGPRARDESRPILTGVLLAAEDDGLRLVATDSYRLAVRDLPGTTVLRREPEGARAVAGAQRAGPAGAVGRTTSRCASASARPRSRSARPALTTRLIEGEFPNYRQLIPQHYPNRLDGRSASALLDAVRRVKLLARDSTPIRLAMSADGLELTATTQDIGQAAESLDAKYEGAEMVVAFNPDYLSAGVDAVAADEVVLETLDALKPAVLRAGGRRRLPVPAHAGAGAVSGLMRRPARPERDRPAPVAHRLPQLHRPPRSSSTTASRSSRATTARARPTSSRRWRGWPRSRASGAHRTEALVRAGAERAVRAGRDRARRRPASCWSRPSCPGPGAIGCRSTGSGWHAREICSGCCGSACSRPTTSRW